MTHCAKDYSVAMLKVSMKTKHCSPIEISVKSSSAPCGGIHYHSAMVPSAYVRLACKTAPHVARMQHIFLGPVRAHQYMT